jgi:nucleoside-diphosphate-sugar epimerase
LDKDVRIYVAGGSTLIGAALLTRLSADGYSEIVDGLGWRAQAVFEDTLAQTYAWYLRCKCEKEFLHA